MGVALLVCAAMMGFHSSCSDQNKEERPASSKVQAAAPLSGEEQANVDMEAHIELQEAIVANSHAAFTACGEAWAANQSPGSELYAKVTLLATSDGSKVTTKPLGEPTINSEKTLGGLRIDDKTKACLDNAFSFSFASQGQRPYRYEVDYPFCIRKPAACPSSVALPRGESAAIFSALPDHSEAIYPLMQELLDRIEIKPKGELFVQCRCNICRVVSGHDSIESSNAWMEAMARSAAVHRDKVGHEKMYRFRFSNERPMEISDGPFVHAYFLF